MRNPSLTDLDVLVVEDNVDAREILTVVLSDAGAGVRMAEDYDSALREIERKWPDVLICDIGLPGRDGIGDGRRGRIGRPTAPIPRYPAAD